VTLALPVDMEARQQTLAAVLALMVVWWITEAIPIPVAGIVGVSLCVALGVAEADEVFGSFSDSTIFLFIGSFIIAEAMLVHGLDRRFAFNILALRAVGDSTYRITIAFGVIGAATSPFLSNTGAAAMMLQIGSPPNLIGRGLLEDETGEPITFFEGRLSRGERNTLIAFGVAVVLWMVPGIVGLVAGGAVLCVAGVAVMAKVVGLA
jgi:di/tricarboxylate transporter